MDPKTYLRHLIVAAESNSSIPIQLSELKTLQRLMETEEETSMRSRMEYHESEQRRLKAIQNRKNLTDADHVTWKALTDENKMIDAIKNFRDMTGCSLKESKDTIDWWRSNREVKYFF